MCFNDNELSIPTLKVIFNTVISLCLVSLRLKPGFDVDATQYFADNWVKLREENVKLTKLYEQNKSELTAKLENAEKVKKFIEYCCVKFSIKVYSLNEAKITSINCLILSFSCFTRI